MAQTIRLELVVDDKGTAVVRQFAGELEKRTGDASKASAAAIRSLGDSFGAVESKMRAFAAPLAGLAGSVAAMFSVGEIVRGGAEMERAMSMVDSYAKLTGAQLDMLREKADEVGFAFGRGDEDAASGMTELYHAGLQTNEVMAMLPTTLRLAKVETADTGVTAKTAAAAMRALGLSADGLGALVDQVAAVASKTGASMNGMLGALALVGPMARQMRIPVEDVIGALGMMSRQGMDAETAGMGLSRMLALLAGKTEEGTKGLKGYNLQLFDSQGKFVGLGRALSQLKSAGISEQDFLAMFGPRNSQMMLRFLNDGAAGLKELAQSAKESGGALAQIAQIRGDNLLGDWAQAKKAFAMLGDEIYGRLAPALREVAQWVTESALAFVEYAKSSTFLDGLARAAKLAAAAIGALIAREVVSTVSGWVASIRAMAAAFEEMMVSATAATAATAPEIFANTAAAMTMSTTEAIAFSAALGEETTAAGASAAATEAAAAAATEYAAASGVAAAAASAGATAKSTQFFNEWTVAAGAAGTATANVAKTAEEAAPAFVGFENVMLSNGRAATAASGTLAKVKDGLSGVAGAGAAAKLQLAGWVGVVGVGAYQLTRAAMEFFDLDKHVTSFFSGLARGADDIDRDARALEGLVNLVDRIGRKRGDASLGGLVGPGEVQHAKELVEIIEKARAAGNTGLMAGAVNELSRYADEFGRAASGANAFDAAVAKIKKDHPEIWARVSKALGATTEALRVATAEAAKADAKTAEAAETRKRNAEEEARRIEELRKSMGEKFAGHGFYSAQTLAEDVRHTSEFIQIAQQKGFSMRQIADVDYDHLRGIWNALGGEVGRIQDKQVRMALEVWEARKKANDALQQERDIQDEVNSKTGVSVKSLDALALGFDRVEQKAGKAAAIELYGEQLIKLDDTIKKFRPDLQKMFSDVFDDRVVAAKAAAWAAEEGEKVKKACADALKDAEQAITSSGGMTFNIGDKFFKSLDEQFKAVGESNAPQVLYAYSEQIFRYVDAMRTAGHAVPDSWKAIYDEAVQAASPIEQLDRQAKQFGYDYERAAAQGLGTQYLAKNGKAVRDLADQYRFARKQIPEDLAAMEKAADKAMRWDSYFKSWQQLRDTWKGISNDIIKGSAQAFSRAMVYGENFAGGMRELGKSILATLLEQLAEYALQWIALQITQQVFGETTAKKQVAGGLAEVYTNSFASAAAIPMVGWLIAPAVAAANLALATGISGALLLGGGAASGGGGSAASDATSGAVSGATAGAAIGSIPAAADGAIAYGPTIGLWGERGSEMITPLEGEPARRAARALGIDRSGGAVEVHHHYSIQITTGHVLTRDIPRQLVEVVYTGIKKAIQSGTLRPLPTGAY